MNDVPLGESEKTNYNGTRKLVRPRLPEGWDRRIGGDRRRPAATDEPLTNAGSHEHHVIESSHAEAFYFQKQVQFQTDMTVVLDDGDHLTGIIEWYDKAVIKLRSGRRRVLVYKAAIKYMYKTSEHVVTSLPQRSAFSAD